MTQYQPVVIIGGTYAGLHTARALDSLWHGAVESPIFLLDPADVYPHPFDEIDQNRSSRLLTIPYDKILRGTRIHHIPESVRRIDSELQQIITDRRKINYSDCVFAVNKIVLPDSFRVTGLRQDDEGRVLVDSTLQSVDTPHLWAVGKVAAVGDSNRLIGAARHGQHVARSIDATRNGEMGSAYLPIEQNRQNLDRFNQIWYNHAKAFRDISTLLPVSEASIIWINHLFGEKSRQGA